MGVVRRRSSRRVDRQAGTRGTMRIRETSSTAFHALHLGKALAGTAAGGTHTKFRGPPFAWSPGRRNKMRLKIPPLTSLSDQGFYGGILPARENVPKPENILKTKGRKREFSPAKPENILKISQL